MRTLSTVPSTQRMFTNNHMTSEVQASAFGDDYLATILYANKETEIIIQLTEKQKLLFPPIPCVCDHM